MMKKILFSGIVLISTILLFSCSTENIDSLLESDVVSDEAIIELDLLDEEILRDISKLIGKTLQSKEARSEILKIVEEVDSYGGGVSFAYLFGNEQDVSKYEKRKIKSLERTSNSFKPSSIFKEHITKTYMLNRSDFSRLDTALTIENKASGNGNFENTTFDNQSIEDIETYLVENDLELYFPYKENFDWDDLISYTVSFENNNPDGIYDGYKYSGMTYEEVSGIIDEYLYQNPTVAIIPIDHDYLGDFLKITHNNQEHYLDPTLPQNEIDDFYKEIFPHLDPTNPVNSFTQSLKPNPGNDIPQRKRLTHNVNPYTFFNENNILTVFIPKVRILGTSWKRTLSKAHRTRIARAGSTIAVDPNGGNNPTMGTFYFDFDISASDLRNKRWKNVGIMFDPNWHKAKGSQQIIVWTKRKNSGKKSVQVKNELKIDKDGNYTPNTSVSYVFDSASGVKAVFRGNVELDRDQVLTTIINGSEYDNATYRHNGVDLSVRRVAEKFEFFFDMHYTNL